MYFILHVQVILTVFLVSPIVVMSIDRPMQWVDPDADLLSSHESRMRQDNWEDPDNHDNFFPTQSQSKSSEKDYKSDLIEVRNRLFSCEVMLQNIVKPVNNGKEDINKDSKSQTNKRATTMPNIETIYVKRFVGMLLQASGLVSVKLEPGESKQAVVMVDIDEEKLATLRGFMNDAATTLEEVNQVLSEVLTPSDSVYYIPLGWLERLMQYFSTSEILSVLTPYALSLFILLMLLYRRRIGEVIATVLLMIFALGYQYTYQHMLKKAEIEQRMTLHKYDSIPESCRHPASMLESFSRWWRGDHRDCEKYFTAQMMPPSMAVTPTLVLSEMLTEMIVHPLGRMGEGFGKFTQGFLGEVSTIHGLLFLPLVLLLICIATIIIVVVLGGGRIRLPFYLGGAILSGDTPRQPVTHHQPAPLTDSNGPAYFEERIRAISREELLVHRIVQQLMPETRRTSEQDLGSRVQRLEIEETSTQLVTSENPARTSYDNLIIFSPEAELVSDDSVEVGNLIDLSMNSAGDNLVIDEVNTVINESRVEEVISGTNLTLQSGVRRDESSLLDASLRDDRPGFLSTLEMILQETESTFTERVGDESNVSGVNTEFMTSIEFIMLDSSAEVNDDKEDEKSEDRRKSSKDSSEDGSDFVEVEAADT